MARWWLRVGRGRRLILLLVLRLLLLLLLLWWGWLLVLWSLEWWGKLALGLVLLLLMGGVWRRIRTVEISRGRGDILVVYGWRGLLVRIRWRRWSTSIIPPVIIVTIMITIKPIAIAIATIFPPTRFPILILHPITPLINDIPPSSLDPPVQYPQKIIFQISYRLFIASVQFMETTDCLVAIKLEYPPEYFWVVNLDRTTEVTVETFSNLIWEWTSADWTGLAGHWGAVVFIVTRINAALYYTL